MKRTLLILCLAVAAHLCAAQMVIRARPGVNFMILRQPSVLKELKVHDATGKKIKDLLDKVQEGSKIEIEGNSDPDEIEKQVKEQFAKLDRDGLKELKADLGPDQYKRFNELNFQSLGAAAFQNDDVRFGLSLTDDQKKKIDDVMKRVDDEVQAVYESAKTDSGGGEVRIQIGKDQQKKIADAQNKGRDAIIVILTEDQKTKWASMIGAKFDFED